MLINYGGYADIHRLQSLNVKWLEALSRQIKRFIETLLVYNDCLLDLGQKFRGIFCWILRWHRQKIVYWLFKLLILHDNHLILLHFWISVSVSIVITAHYILHLLVSLRTSFQFDIYLIPFINTTQLNFNHSLSFCLVVLKFNSYLCLFQSWETYIRLWCLRWSLLLSLETFNLVLVLQKHKWFYFESIVVLLMADVFCNFICISNRWKLVVSINLLIEICWYSKGYLGSVFLWHHSRNLRTDQLHIFQVSIGQIVMLSRIWLSLSKTLVGPWSYFV